MKIDQFIGLLKQACHDEDPNQLLVGSRISWFNYENAQETDIQNCYAVGVSEFLYLMENKLELELIFSDAETHNKEGLIRFTTLDSVIRNLEATQQEHKNLEITISARVLIDEFQEGLSIPNQKVEVLEGVAWLHCEEWMEKPTVLVAEKFGMKETFCVDQLDRGTTIIRRFLTDEEVQDIETLRQWSHPLIETVFIPKNETSEEVSEDIDTQQIV